jgi:hypothetical protein
MESLRRALTPVVAYDTAVSNFVTSHIFTLGGAPTAHRFQPDTYGLAQSSAARRILKNWTKNYYSFTTLELSEFLESLVQLP